MACCRKHKKWDTVRLSRFRGQIGMDVIWRERSRQDDINICIYILLVLCYNIKLNTFNCNDLTTHGRNE